MKHFKLAATVALAALALAAGTYQCAQAGPSLVGGPASPVSMTGGAPHFVGADCSAPVFEAAPIVSVRASFSPNAPTVAEPVAKPRAGTMLAAILGLLAAGGVSIGAVATAEWDAPEREGRMRFYPLAAATKIFQGTIVALNAAGNVVAASDTAGLRVIGRAEQTVDNTSGAAGDLSINVKLGVFKYANSAGDAVTAAEKGKLVYVEDNTTVCKSGATNFVKAGRVVDVESDGVWIDMAHAQVVPTAFATGSVQEATVNGSDAGTTQTLANSLKAKYNALQTDFTALITALKAQGTLK